MLRSAERELKGEYDARLSSATSETCMSYCVSHCSKLPPWRDARGRGLCVTPAISQSSSPYKHMRNHPGTAAVIPLTLALMSRLSYHRILKPLVLRKLLLFSSTPRSYISYEAKADHCSSSTHINLCLYASRTRLHHSLLAVVYW